MTASVVALQLLKVQEEKECVVCNLNLQHRSYLKHLKLGKLMGFFV